MSGEYSPPEETDYAKQRDSGKQGTESKEDSSGTTDDPKEFLDKFKTSPSYQADFSARKEQTLARNPNLTEEEVEEVFLKSNEAKRSFHDFYQRDLKITYNPDKYSNEFKTELAEYFRLSRSNQTRERLGRFSNQSDLVQAEQDRMGQHDKAADQLVADGVMPNFRLARVYVHFLAVSEAIDNFAPGRDEYRVRVRGF